MESVQPTTNKDVKNIIHGRTTGLEQKLTDVTHSAQEKLAEEAEMVNQLYNDLVAVARKKANQAYDVSTSYVRSYPLTTVAGAVAVGMLAGFLISRK